MAGQRLTPTERVRRRPDFQRAYDAGSRVHGRYMTLFVVPNSLDVARLGVSATRKLGSAVERNRAKRLVREVFRRHKVAAPVDVIVVPRREMLDAPFATIESDYLTTLARAVSERQQPRRSSGRRRRDRSDSSV